MKPTNMYMAGWLLGMLCASSWGAIILPENVDWSTPSNWYLDETGDPEPTFRSEPSPGQPEPRVRVSLRPPSSVLGDMVTLRDVADIECRDSALFEAVAAIDLGASPRPGDSVFLFPNRIEASLRKLGLSSGDFVIEGPERIALSGESQVVTMEEVEEAITAALMARALSGPGGTVEAFLTRKVAPLHLPLGKLEIEALDLDRPGGGLRQVQLAFLVDGRKVDTRAFPIRVDHQSHGLVASRSLAVGEKIGPADLTEGLIPVSNRTSLSGLVFDPEKLLGNRVSRPIAAGEPIAEADLIRDPLRVRGDRVNLVHRVGKVQTTAPGELLEDALEIGQPVRVKTTNSKKTFVGKLLSPWEVEVN